jgi:large subunit ribosomal protein L34e
MVHTKHATRGKSRIEMRGEARYRSRSFKRVQRKTPGARTVTHYTKSSPSVALCGLCKEPLHGLPRARDIKVRSFSRSQLTVQRPFGANLCSGCSREIIRWRARVQHKLVRLDEIPISYKQYVKVSA